ncbi:MAG: membrane protein insertion efficiency factor YidD [Patescibacteria group bacterium]|jgi:hypothetical protein
MKKSFNYYIKALFLKAISLYQKTLSPDHGWFSETTPYGCKFHPTCSEYSYQAIDKYGIIRGGLLSTKRVLRCHPFSRGGYDPIP